MRRKTDAEKLDALNRQYKQKNQYIAANYDRIGIVTPKGTREYIKSLGMSANSYINGLIEADRRRREAAEDPDTDLQENRHEGPETKPQEAPQDAASGARTNRQAATKSPTEGRTEAQEGTTSAATKGSNPQEEPKPRGRSRKASAATTGGPEEGTTAGSPENTTAGSPAGSPQDAQPVEAADAPQPINPGDNLQNMLLYPYGMHDDIPPEELPFH